jgi:hypothetical protein
MNGELWEVIENGIKTVVHKEMGGRFNLLAPELFF